MTALSFIAEVIRAFAWPAAIFAIALIFRNEIAKFITGVRSVSAAGVSIEIERRLQEAKAEAEQLPQQRTFRREGIANSASTREELALLYPGAVILAVWGEIEQGLYATAEQAGLDTRRLGPATLLRQLREANAVDPTIFALADDLRDIRNQVAHPRGGGPDVTQDQAREYIHLAEQVLAALHKPDAAA